MRSIIDAGPPLTYSILDCARVLGCSRSRVFELLAEKKLEAAPMYGRNRMVFRRSVEDLLLEPGTARKRARLTRPNRKTLAEEVASVRAYQKAARGSVVRVVRVK